MAFEKYAENHMKYTKKKCMVPTVKCSERSVLVWGSMSSQSVGLMYFIDGIINVVIYCDIMQKKLLYLLFVDLVMER